MVVGHVVLIHGFWSTDGSAGPRGLSTRPAGRAYASGSGRRLDGGAHGGT
jgi:hypothetical protein